MSCSEQYAPSTDPAVRDHIERYEASGSTDGVVNAYGRPVVVLTSRGARSGKIRKTPLIRIAADGTYAVVASVGGASNHPGWYYNLIAHPDVLLQDGPVIVHLRAREVFGAEKSEWWSRAVAVNPKYTDYQLATPRQLPVLVLEPVGPSRP